MSELKKHNKFISLESWSYYVLFCQANSECQEHIDFGFVDVKELTATAKEMGWKIIEGGISGRWSCPGCQVSD